MISAFANSLKIPELRQRIFFTLLVIVIVRLGANIPLPGIDVSVRESILQQMQEQAGGSKGFAAVMALMNVFSGGGLQNSALFALGVMPYISASIMMQLLTAVVPQLGKLAREDGGRQKINLYTRYVTIVLCIFQGWVVAQSLVNIKANPFLSQFADSTTSPLVPDGGLGFMISTVIIVTAGTMFLMWLGDQITERGIGNGVSIIITVNIIFALPGALVQLYKTYVDVDATGGDPLRPLILVVLIAFLFLVIAAVIAITQAQRRISIHYAKRVVGRKMYGGQTQYMPLKVNYAGVMPIIFANAILVFPAQIVRFMFPEAPWAAQLSNALSGGGWVYYTLTGLMIFFFSYFWVATMFQPNQIADDLKKNGGYIPGVRPGRPTAEFLDFTMSRLTFAGAIFLTLVAVLPGILINTLGVPAIPAQLFGGTSLLIMVGVILDVMRQVETHLIQRHYDGFLRKGRIRGRFDRPGGKGAAASGGSVIWLFVGAAILIILGVTYFLISQG